LNRKKKQREFKELKTQVGEERPKGAGGLKNAANNEIKKKTGEIIKGGKT